MIIYEGGSFGLSTLTRLHGSAVFRSLTPALVSSAIFILLFHATSLNVQEERIFGHPYPMGALIAAFTFLLTFRANFSYNRYWEAMGAVHLMHSKWLDFATEVASFHYQSERYDAFKPRAYGSMKDGPHNFLYRTRERQHEPTKEQLESKIDDMVEQDQNLNPSLRSRFQMLKGDDETTSKKEFPTRNHSDKSDPPHVGEQLATKTTVKNGTMVTTAVAPTSSSVASTRNQHRISQQDIELNNSHTHSDFQKATRDRLRSGGLGDDAPQPLFLEEVAHLLSLLSAVALSTLRNDIEGAESPLASFRPGAPWPHADPDAYSADVRKDWARSTHQSWTYMRYLAGTSRTKASRTLYNAARPFRVVGNVSDNEIHLLQTARGPLAKVALCTLWLQEFLSREYLNGSTGKVAPPIVSRLYQFVSDGMLGYNQARKIAYVPFPFPHAQITTLFVLIIVGFIPVLMLSYVKNPYFGFVLNMFTVMCFTGLHEVARELENPFINVPNDIPLNNFQAQFNEGLMTMFYGYHPDAYCDVSAGMSKENDGSTSSSDEEQHHGKEDNTVVVSVGNVKKTS